MHEEASATTMSVASSSVAASTSQAKAGVASVLAVAVSPEAQVPDGDLLPYEDGSTGTYITLTAYCTLIICCLYYIRIMPTNSLLFTHSVTRLAK